MAHKLMISRTVKAKAWLWYEFKTYPSHSGRNCTGLIKQFMALCVVGSFTGVWSTAGWSSNFQVQWKPKLWLWYEIGQHIPDTLIYTKHEWPEKLKIKSFCIPRWIVNLSGILEWWIDRRMQAKAMTVIWSWRTYPRHLGRHCPENFCCRFLFSW